MRVFELLATAAAQLRMESDCERRKEVPLLPELVSWH
jgi:hypothetical protein